MLGLEPPAAAEPPPRPASMALWPNAITVITAAATCSGRQEWRWGEKRAKYVGTFWVLGLIQVSRLIA